MKAKNLFQVTTASFVGVTTSLLLVNGLTAAHHNYWAYQWSKTCNFKPYAVFHAEKATALNPIYGQDLMRISLVKSC